MIRAMTRAPITTSPSPEGMCLWCGRRVVSWLRAASLTFPTEVSGVPSAR
jgi:hypothetical protein